MAQAQKNKPRLGRGLSSLISVSDLPVEAETSHGAVVEQTDGQTIGHRTPLPGGQPLMLALDMIRPNPHQPRKTIGEAAIGELAASIKSSGVIQPIVVRRTESGYELIAGQRRWMAAGLAGLAEVPAIVKDVDAFTQAQMALVENIQREDLNPIERAQGYRVLMEQLGLTQAELAERMGEDRSGIANYLRLLDLAESVRQMVKDGRLSLGHAKILAGMGDILEQQRLAEIVLAQSLSVRNLERMLQTGGQAPATRKATGSVAHLMDLEKSLSRQLGMRVQVRSTSKGKGRMVLHYASLDQFDELLKKLGVSAE